MEGGFQGWRVAHGENLFISSMRGTIDMLRARQRTAEHQSLPVDRP